MSRFSKRGLIIPTMVLAAALVGLGYWTLSQQQRLLSGSLRAGGFERAAAVQELFEQLRVDSLSSKASALADNQAFVAYAAQALNVGALPDSPVDVSSVSDLLGERAEQQGFAVAAVIDSSGRVLASSDAAVTRGQNLQRDAVLDQVAESGSAAITVLEGGNAPVLAAIVPMQRGGLFDGFLLAGLRVDAAMMEDLAQATAAEVSLLQRSKDQVILRFSNAPPELQQQLPDLVARAPSIPADDEILLQTGDDTLRLNRLFAADQLLLAYHLPAEAISPSLQAVARPLQIAYLGCGLLFALWLWWMRRRLLGHGT